MPFIHRGTLLGLLVLIFLGTLPAAAVAPPKETLFREKLSNGMQVIILENHRHPLVSVNVFVKVGSMHEDERINGISHFFEHLFFRGTARRTGEEFKREIESLGGQTNAKTTKDLTHYYINLPSQYAAQGLDILADALQNSRLAASEVDQERKVVMDEYRISLESPGSILQSLMYSMAFRKHPYRLPIIGTEKSLKELKIQDFVDFKKKYYVPGRTVLVIVGDVTPAQIMPAVREYFGSFSGPTVAEADNVPAETGPPEVREVVERRDLQNAFVVLGFKAPSVRDRPDIYRVDLLTFLLGQGEGALLNKRLVEDKKLAIGIGADFLTQRDPGVITISATTQPPKVERVREAMVEVVKDIREGRFTDNDFKRAKALLRNTYLFGNETNSGKADGLGFYASIDEVDFALSYLEEIEKVTKADVIEAAKKYLDLNNYSVLVVRPPDRRASADD